MRLRTARKYVFWMRPSRWWDGSAQEFAKTMHAAWIAVPEHPLVVYATRQFPLKGKRYKPFWEYEISGGDRLYYAVDLYQQVIVVSVMPHATRSEPMTKRVRDWRAAFEGLVAEQQAAAALRPPKAAGAGSRSSPQAVGPSGPR
jgi:hypothetical protein